MKILHMCPICQCEDIAFQYEGVTGRVPCDQHRWGLRECRNCTHGFINPQPTWDELKPYYDTHYPPYEATHGSLGEDEEVVAQARQQGRFRHVRIQPGMRILDVGSGGGYFLRIAQRLDAVVQGIEPSEVGSERSRAQGLPVYHGTVHDYYRSGSTQRFDLITLCHVLEHMPDPVENLLMLRELLAPAGTIWIAVPNASSCFARKLRDRWHSTDLPFHLMQFTPQSIRATANRAGLKVSQIWTRSLVSGVAESVRTWLRRRWFLPSRLTARWNWLNNTYAARLTAKLDRQMEGEAILASLQ